MKHAGVFFRSGRFFLYSMHKLVSGAHLAQDDAVAVSEDEPEGIGMAIRSKLDAYREGLPIPSRETMKGEKLQALNLAAGVRSSREFMHGAKKLSVRSSDGGILITPWKNEGLSGSFVPLKRRERQLDDSSSNVELGAAIIATLAEAE